VARHGASPAAWNNLKIVVERAGKPKQTGKIFPGSGETLSLAWLPIFVPLAHPDSQFRGYRMPIPKLLK